MGQAAVRTAIPMPLPWSLSLSKILTMGGRKVVPSRTTIPLPASSEHERRSGYPRTRSSGRIRESHCAHRFRRDIAVWSGGKGARRLVREPITVKGLVLVRGVVVRVLRVLIRRPIVRWSGVVPRSEAIGMTVLPVLCSVLSRSDDTVGPWRTRVERLRSIGWSRGDRLVRLAHGHFVGRFDTEVGPSAVLAQHNSG